MDSCSGRHGKLTVCYALTGLTKLDWRSAQRYLEARSQQSKIKKFLHFPSRKVAVVKAAVSLSFSGVDITPYTSKSESVKRGARAYEGDQKELIKNGGSREELADKHRGFLEDMAVYMNLMEAHTGKC